MLAGREAQRFLRRRAGARRGIAHRRGRNDRGDRRRQRRRQDLADPHHRRHASAGIRAHRVSRAPISPACRATASATSASARSPRDGRSSPRSPSPKTSTWARCCRGRAITGRPEPRAGPGDVSKARGTARPGRRHAFGRRAADAGDRPLHHGRAQAHHVRRALAGARADGGP